MTSYDKHQRTFPGMYNSHYMDAYAAFDPVSASTPYPNHTCRGHVVDECLTAVESFPQEKSDWNKLNPKRNR